MDESIVVVGKTQKLLDTLDMLRWFPIGNRSHLIFIHLYFPWAHNVAKVLYTWLTKLILLKFGLELVLTQSLEN